MSDSLTNTVPNSSLDASCASNNCAEQELNDLWEILKEQRNKYTKLKCICDSLTESCIENDEVDSSLKEKVKNVILRVNCQQSAALDDLGTSIFGLNLTNDSVTLNFKEKEKLTQLIKDNLKYEDFASQSEFLDEDKTLIEFQEKCLIEMQQFASNLQEEEDLLEKIVDLRLKSVPGVIDKQYDNYKELFQINELKSDLTQAKLHMDIFNETDISFEAYKELFKDIEETKSNLKKELENLKDLKRQYDNVACKEYDAILTSYIQYKRNIEKKKRIIDQLNN